MEAKQETTTACAGHCNDGFEPCPAPRLCNTAHEQSNQLIRREFVQRDRRFSGQAITGFGEL